jgi:hypothetical protein
MNPSAAHCSSLPFYAAILRVSSLPVWEALKDLTDTLEHLKLERDIRVVVVLGGKGGPVIDFEPLSRYGTLVLDELKTRSEFLPCPDGGCDYDASDVCRWCGKVK